MSCAPELEDARRAIVANAAALEAAAFGLTAFASVFPPGGVVAVALRTCIAAARQDCDPSKTAADLVGQTLIICPHVPTLERLGVPFVGTLKWLCGIGVNLQNSLTREGPGYMPIDRFSTDVVGDFVKPSAVVIARRGSFVGAVDRARNIVPVPSRDIDADDSITDNVVASVADYASALSQAAKETEAAGVVDMQRLLRIQCEVEIMALNKFTDWLSSQTMAAVAKKTTGAQRAYLAAVQGNRTPAPWSGDVVQDIINDPTKTYGTVDVGERLPVDDGAGEPPSSGAGLGIAAAVLIGLAALR